MKSKYPFPLLSVAAFSLSLAACAPASDPGSDAASSMTDDPAVSTEETEARRPRPTATPTPVPTSTPTPAPTGTAAGLSGTATLDAEELAFATLINDYRAKNGLPALRVSIALTRASDWLSVDMAAKNYFSHADSLGRDPFVRMTAFGHSGGYRGENIAAGNATAQATFTQWKNSAGHNANMLSANYKVIGIGRANKTGSSYGWYWTTDFGSTVDALAY